MSMALLHPSILKRVYFVRHSFFQYFNYIIMLVAVTSLVPLTLINENENIYAFFEVLEIFNIPLSTAVKAIPHVIKFVSHPSLF